ncbi:MAG: hypothetical protein K2L98_04435 [Bacilli bacterium]|nr:hypothetical protein [Bacilli bacterium]
MEKIVYVLTSDYSDNYLEQLSLSLYSLRLHNPSLYVEIVVDRETNLSLRGDRLSLIEGASLITAIDVPAGYDKMRKSRWLKTNLRNLIAGDFLFVDTDTIICDNIDFSKISSGEISAVKDLHVNVNNHAHKYDILDRAKIVNWDLSDENKPYYNSGVLYVRDSDKTRQFYKVWNETWKVSEANGCASDQPSLCKTNELFGGIITPLDDNWNCQITENGIRFLSEAIIIHYFASGKSKALSPYIFNNENIYCKIKNEGLTESIKQLLENPKQAFIPKVQLISDKDAELFNSPLSKYLRKFFYSCPRFYKKMISLGRKIKHI